MSFLPTLKADFIAPTPARTRRRILELQSILYFQSASFLFKQSIILC